jgi:hypothetical protein
MDFFPRFFPRLVEHILKHSAELWIHDVFVAYDRAMPRMTNFVVANDSRTVRDSKLFVLRRLGYIGPEASTDTKGRLEPPTSKEHFSAVKYVQRVRKRDE